MEAGDKNKEKNLEIHSFVERNRGKGELERRKTMDARSTGYGRLKQNFDLKKTPPWKGKGKQIERGGNDDSKKKVSHVVKGRMV